MSDLENLKALAVKVLNRTADDADLVRFDVLKKICGVSTSELIAELEKSK